MSRPTYKRAERVADQIRMEIADILARKSKDPRLTFVTVTDVEISQDLRVARVFVSWLGEGRGAGDIFKGLESAKGYIRTELGRRLALRYTPEIIFKEDVSGPRGERIWRLLDELQGGEHHSQENP